jgi:hypothetical protein
LLPIDVQNGYFVFLVVQNILRYRYPVSHHLYPMKLKCRMIIIETRHAYGIHH